MKIDTLWFEKQSVGSAARIESMSFRACDLLQCLIFVMTIPQMNFCWICVHLSGSIRNLLPGPTLFKFSHFISVLLLFLLFLSFFFHQFTMNRIHVNLFFKIRNCTQFHMITYNWLDWVDSEIIPTLNSFSLITQQRFGAKEKKVLWIEHLLPSRDAEVLRFRAGLSEIGPSCA